MWDSCSVAHRGLQIHDCIAQDALNLPGYTYSLLYITPSHSVTPPFDMDGSGLTFAADTQHLIEDRDNLQNMVAYLWSANAVLAMQNKRYAEMLETAGVPLYSSTNSESTAVDWVAGSYLYRHSEDHHLMDSINTYREHKSSQRAMALLTLKISTGNMTDAQKVHAQLLLSAMLRASSDAENTGGVLEQALALADDALHKSENLGDYGLVSESHFHRGLCYLHLNMLANAKWSFVLASEAPGYSELAQLQRQVVESKIDALPVEDRKRLYLQGFLS